jgi:transposase
MVFSTELWTSCVLPEGPRMAACRIVLTPDELDIVHDQREHHTNPIVRRKMLVLWLTHCQTSRLQTARVAQLGRATVQRYLAAYRAGGLDGLRRCDCTGPVSALAEHADLIRKSLTDQPVRTIAEARDRIASLTGLHRGLTQTRKFLRGLGFTWQRTRAVPVPPKRR